MHACRASCCNLSSRTRSVTASRTRAIAGTWTWTSRSRVTCCTAASATTARDCLTTPSVKESGSRQRAPGSDTSTETLTSSSFVTGPRAAPAPSWPSPITHSTARRRTDMDFPKIRTMIVDDEELGRERVRMMLSEHPDIEVVAECSDGPEAVRNIERERPDLVFLDVQMPGMNGFEVLETLEGDPLPAVVFVTAHDDYALRAFDIHALDFLLKPFDQNRFEKTLDRARSQVSQSRTSAIDSRILSLLEDLKGDKRYPDRLIVKSGGR